MQTTQTQSPERRSVRARALQRLQARGFRWLYVLDIAALLAVQALIGLVRWDVDWPARYIYGALAATAIHLVVYYFGGMYDREERLGSRMWLARVSLLTGVAVLFDALAALLTGTFLMPRGNLVALFVLASLALTFNRWLSRRLRVRRFGRPQVLLVGRPDDIELARNHLAESDRQAVVAGHVSTPRDLVTAVDETRASDVLLLSSGVDAIYPEPLESLERRGTGLYQRITPADTMLGLQRVRQIAGMPFVALRAHTLPESRLHFKRTLELVYLLCALPLLLPVGLVLAAIVRITAGRGIFFKQERVGKDGRPFRMIKFRTMVHDAEAKTGATKAATDDDRIIRSLRWMRAARLDEIPQFINVLRGEMSIVGPRPERPEFTGQYESLIPGYSRRHEVPPGITGLAQVRGSYHTDPGYKLGHDLQYLVNWSPILDIQIMLQTVWTMVTGR